MVNGNCAVVGCTNSTYKLKKWKTRVCEIHTDRNHADCPCQPPFRLHTFPSELRFAVIRDKWILAINRETKKKKPWKPGKSDVICSVHFVDGMPTAMNPAPTLELGYYQPVLKPRRKLVRNVPVKQQIDCNRNDHVDSTPTDVEDDDGVISGSAIQCMSCADSGALKEEIAKLREEISILKKEKAISDTKIKYLTKEIKGLKLKNSKKGLSVEHIKKDSEMIFCTGLSIKVFNALFKILKPHLPTLVYWRGRNAVAVKPNKCKRQRKFRLLYQNQMLLVLMRLRLGILMQDLAMRFDVSVASCSAIFTTWIKFLSSSIANALVIWLPKETVLSNLPMVFVKGGYKKPGAS